MSKQNRGFQLPDTDNYVPQKRELYSSGNYKQIMKNNSIEER